MKAVIAVSICCLAAVVAMAVYYHLPENRPGSAIPAAPAPEMAERSPRYPIYEPWREAESEDATGGTPEAHEGAFENAVASLVGERFKRHFHSNGLVQRFVATVDNLALESLPVSMMPVKPVPGWTATTGQGESLALSAVNYRRYRPYIELLDAVPTQSLVHAYVRFYPLLQEQYEKLGYPGRYFNDRVVEVIDLMLRTPRPDGPVKLVQTGVLYQFDDPELEALPAGQKILLRMGPENAARVKAKLRELRGRLTAMAPARR